MLMFHTNRSRLYQEASEVFRPVHFIRLLSVQHPEAISRLPANVSDRIIV